MTPAERRSESATIAVLTSWARTPGREARALRTRPAFNARMRKYAAQAELQARDRGVLLSSEELERAAHDLMALDMRRLAKRSREARERRAAGRRAS